MHLKALLSVCLIAAGVMPILATNPNNIDDGEDELLSGMVSDGTDITRWYVSEPYINLWLYSQPVTYQTSYGTPIGFGVAWKQRNSRANPNVFGLGPGWECSWLSYIEYSLSGTNVTSSTAFMPLGGERNYVPDGATRDFKSYTTLTPLRNGGNTVIGFRIDKPTGARDSYTYLLNLAATNNLAFLTEQVDAVGHTNLFQYETVAGNVVRLLRMIDSDNRTNSFAYETSTSSRLYHLTAAYGRQCWFSYDSSSNLTNITNAASMSDRFYYDIQKLVTNVTTAYGNTSFRTTTNSYGGFTLGGTNQINRSIIITDPDGTKEMYFYRDQSTKLNAGSSIDLIPGSYGTNEVPVTLTLTNTFDNTQMDARNSYHWGKDAYNMGLSTNFLLTLNFNNLNTNDYKLATIKHWLRFTNDQAYVSDTLSVVRNGSPDGTNYGAKLWYDYAGKSGLLPWCRGTNSAPSFEAVVLPDGSSRFKYNEQNRWGFPTKVTTTYSSNGIVALRSLTFAYANNDIDLITARGPSNELLSSNAYNSAHQVLRTYNAVNDLTTFTYDSAARLTSTRTPGGLTTTNIYYTSGSHVGFLAQNIDLEIGRTNGFGYYNGVVQYQTNSLGLITTNVIDDLNRTTQLLSSSMTVTNTYVDLDLFSTSDALAGTNSFHYDDMGRAIELTDPDNHTTGLERCVCGAVISVNDPLSRETDLEHDFNGNQISVTLPDQATSLLWAYDSLGQMTNVQLVGVSSVTNYYNNQGQLAFSSNALGQVSAALYDIYDRVTNATDVNGITVQTTYDLLGRTLTTTYPDGGVEQYSYSSLGVVAYTNQLGRITSYGYDVAGRLTSVTNANGEVSRYVYDAEGDMTQMIDGKNQTSWFVYDAYGRLLRQTNAAGSLVLTNGYDMAGNLTKRWTPAKGLVSFSYDASANLTNINYPLSHDIGFEYDEANELSSMVDASGTTIYGYSTNGEMASVDGPWPYDTISYTYTNGMRRTMTLQQPNGPDLVFSYDYDAANRLQTLSSIAGTFTYNYQQTDAAKSNGTLIRKLSLPNGSYVTNAFNSMGQLLGTYLKNGANSTLNSHSYAYNTGAQRTRHTRTAGDYIDFTYDNIGQLKSAFGKEPNAASRLNEKFGYAYDGAGNLHYRTNNALIQTFTVDSLNQLSGATRAGTLTVSGTAGPNVSTVEVNAATASQYVDSTFALDGFTITNGANSFTAVGSDTLGRSATNTFAGNLPSTVSMAYDANGNLVSDGSMGYDYDDENQMIGVRTKDEISQFVYDGQNRRRTVRPYNYSPSTNAISVVQFPFSVSSGFTGWHGVRFTVGATPIYVTELGRYRVNSSTATHTVKLTTAAGADILGASVTVDLSTGNGFVYAALSAPVLLSANTSYYLISSCTAADPYYDCSFMHLASSSAITIDGSVYIDSMGISNSPSWCNGALGYGPVSFNYKVILQQTDTRSIHYIYDGNLVIQERDANNLPLVTYTRGLDLSGSLDGAGGIGGLLARTDHTVANGGATAYYHQDGNGNVTCLVDQHQTIAAKYLYEPFGRILAQSGPLADANRMQFSGKETDRSSGLSYYGKRLYNPELQRWVNKDPAGFADGLNADAFSRNDPVNAGDPDGQVVASWNWQYSYVRPYGFRQPFLELTLIGNVNISFCCAPEISLIEKKNMINAAKSIWGGGTFPSGFPKNGMTQMATGVPAVLMSIRFNINVDYSDADHSRDPLWNTVSTDQTPVGDIPQNWAWLNAVYSDDELRNVPGISTFDLNLTDARILTANRMFLFPRRLDYFTIYKDDRYAHSGSTFFDEFVFAHEFGHLVGAIDYGEGEMPWPNIMRPQKEAIVNAFNAHEILLSNNLWRQAQMRAMALPALFAFHQKTGKW